MVALDWVISGANRDPSEGDYYTNDIDRGRGAEVAAKWRAEADRLEARS